MSSTNKTQNIHLNQWLGTDKPKRADFNADNAAIDAAVTEHTTDTVRHITADERNYWNNRLVTGSYVGNNSPMFFSLPSRPKFVAVMPVNYPNCEYYNSTVFSYFAMATGSSQSPCITVEDMGFTVKNHVNSSFEPKSTTLLSNLATQYMYFAAL
jgi:hypothetical protein